MTGARLLLIMLTGASLPAAAAAQQVDSSVTRLKWGPVNVLLVRDSTTGIRLWVAPNAAGERSGLEGREFVGDYDPAAVERWLVTAERLLSLDLAGPRDTDEIINTVALVDERGGRLVAARRREGPRWSRRVFFSLRAGATVPPVMFAIDLGAAGELVRALGEGARASRLAPRDSLHLVYANPADSTSCPQLIGKPGLRYPDYLRRTGVEGDVWVTFVVDPAGRARLDESFRVLLSDDRDFTRAARDFLERARYRPVVADGAPIAVRMFQRVGFRLAR
jgi:hypothetical protein